jgi:hypothetical protein
VADRDLGFKEMEKLFLAHGCQFQFNRKTQYITIIRGSGPDHLYKKVHAHKGRKDHFDRWVVASARRGLGLGALTDAEFYAPLA